MLWWAAKHRHHHLHSDTDEDVHSPRRKGFIYSHLGWIFDRKHDQADLTQGRGPDALARADVAEEIRAVAGGRARPSCAFLVAGWSGLVVGFLWSTVLVYHATFCINSLAHVNGSKRYVTGDDSRNNWLLAIVTLGEGWHNNHHAYQSSVRQGFRWWEVDPAYYVLKAMSWIGLIWDLKTPPEHVLRNEQRLGARIVNRAAEQLAAHFNSERIALAITTALHGPALSALAGQPRPRARAHERSADDIAPAAHAEPRRVRGAGEGDVRTHHLDGRDRRPGLRAPARVGRRAPCADSRSGRPPIAASPTRTPAASPESCG